MAAVVASLNSCSASQLCKSTYDRPRVRAVLCVECSESSEACGYENRVVLWRMWGGVGVILNKYFIIITFIDFHTSCAIYIFFSLVEI